MFSFIKNWINNHRIIAVEKHIADLEKRCALFEPIVSDEKSYRSLIDKFVRADRNAEIVARYSDILCKIEKHNDDVKSLTAAYDVILQSYPISSLTENIINNKDKLKEISSLIDAIYAYTFPDNFSEKETYDTYKQEFEDLLSDYDTVLRQHDLVSAIYERIQDLPDIYLDEEQAEYILGDIHQIIRILESYPKLYLKIPAISDQMIEDHNENYIQRHLTDTIFNNVNGKSLDQEQRRAILCDSKANLTIAGAGSGKTLTICGKVKHILENKYAKPQEILLLSYSKNSVSDLSKKVHKFCPNLHTDTFHALGYKILAEHDNGKKAVEDQLKFYITEYFKKELSKDAEMVNLVFKFFTLYFYPDTVPLKPYKNEGELFEDLKRKDYKTLKDRLTNLSNNKERRETLNHEFVKSMEELAIANFLYINGISYNYEHPYKVDTKSLKHRQYSPDFYLPDHDIYIEHYGINREERAPQYTLEESDRYIESMQWKRNLHLSYGTTCIETYSYEFNEGTIFDHLTAKLAEHNIRLRPMSQEDILKALHNIFKGRDFTSFYNLLLTFLSLYKAQYKDENGFYELKKRASHSIFEAERTSMFLDICKAIYLYYIRSLKENDKIDFDDMILRATGYLDDTPNFKYRYIIVDEFQDISISRATLLKKLIAHGNSKLFAVGDDWQAIYRFAGCDINIFLKFKDCFAPGKLNFITSTHRNSAELQKVVEPFITANPAQFKKHIRSDIHQENPVRLIYHENDPETALISALKDIEIINPEAEVLILGRNKRDIDAFTKGVLRITDCKSVDCTLFSKMRLTYSTVHASKGLESEFVILISGEDAQYGFPNKIEDDPILELLLGEENDYPFSEERRLFYVALTRTKFVVYLLANQNNPSSFIQEIECYCTILGQEPDKTISDIRTCPSCKSGHLVLRKNERGSFYGCSNYPYCKYTNKNIKMVQNNKRCPACGDYLILREGNSGYFYGCHNYPLCRYTEDPD